MKGPAKLTTHVLDTARGCPARGVRIELWSLDDPQPRLLKTAITNADGRLDNPLLTADELRAGSYELLFHAGDYFASACEKSLPEPPPSSVNAGKTAPNSGATPFLDKIPVRFRITDPSVSYHIPLLMSPWSYTTYRGS